MSTSNSNSSSSARKDDRNEVVIVDVTKPILERFRLDGQIALVTGGGQGIGRAFCYALAQAGASVAVVDIQETLSRKVSKELQSFAYEAVPIVADVTQPHQVQRMIKETIAAFPNRQLTIGVNNAGIGDWMAAEDVTDENWNKITNVNLRGVFLCCQEEAKVMLRYGYGKIINTASMSASIVNWPQKQVVYNTTKAGVKHMTKSLAAEFADRGIRVNCISPGYTKTALLVDLLQTPKGKEYGSKWKSMTPANRFGEVTDYMGAVVFLASEASNFMTGHDMIIDGGYCAL